MPSKDNEPTRRWLLRGAAHKGRKVERRERAVPISAHAQRAAAFGKFIHHQEALNENDLLQEAPTTMQKCRWPIPRARLSAFAWLHGESRPGSPVLPAGARLGRSTSGLSERTDRNGARGVILR
jgi:hypothetical protein